MQFWLNLLRGNLETRTSSWARVQVGFGLLCIFLGSILLTLEKSELRPINLKLTLTRRYGQIYLATEPADQYQRDFQIVTTTYVPTWESALNVIVGIEFFIMGLVLRSAVKEKNASKCTAWLIATLPMLFATLCGSLYKWYEKPNLYQLTNIPIWTLLGNCVYVVYMFRKKNCLGSTIAEENEAVSPIMGRRSESSD